MKTPKRRSIAYPDSPQWARGRFRNSTPKPPDMPEPDAKAIWNFFFNKPADAVPDGPLPVHMLSRAELDAAPDRSLYRLGHSTVLMKLRGGWWLTDPVFSERASPFSFLGPKRFHPPPISIDELPPISGVILSHDHYDHLDHAAIMALHHKVEIFLTPLGVGDRLIAWGVPAHKIRQLDWWQETESHGLHMACTPAQHFSGRRLKDGNQTLWCSWVIQDDDLRIFFSGDSGYFDGFKEIGRRYGPFKITLMETGAYNENWPYVHMQPEESVQAHIDLRGEWLIPIHNGTFALAMHPWWEPVERVVALGTAREVLTCSPNVGNRIDLNAPSRTDP